MILPKRADIVTFLGRDFFPHYSTPQTVKETIDIVQLQFNISDEARKLLSPRAHGTDGTVLEALVLFSIQDLVDLRCLEHVGVSTYQWRKGAKYLGHCCMREVNECLVSFKILKEKPVDEICMLLKSRWNEDTVLAARAKWELTTNREEAKIGI